MLQDRRVLTVFLYHLCRWAVCIVYCLGGMMLLWTLWLVAVTMFLPWLERYMHHFRLIMNCVFALLFLWLIPFEIDEYFEIWIPIIPSDISIGYDGSSHLLVNFVVEEQLYVIKSIMLINCLLSSVSSVIYFAWHFLVHAAGCALWDKVWFFS